MRLSVQVTAWVRGTCPVDAELVRSVLRIRDLSQASFPFPRPQVLLALLVLILHPNQTRYTQMIWRDLDPA
jgi:hypothetical protein